MQKTVSRSLFDRQIMPDECPDTSYLEQDDFTDRLQQYKDGQFSFVGVRASVEIDIPHGQGSITQRITSPGLWGIEDDSGADYLAEVFAEESNILAEMLQELGYTVTD
jgi:hypothetical protein